MINSNKNSKLTYVNELNNDESQGLEWLLFEVFLVDNLLLGGKSKLSRFLFYFHTLKVNYPKFYFTFNPIINL